LSAWVGYRDIMNTYVVPRIGSVPLQRLDPRTSTASTTSRRPPAPGPPQPLSAKTVLNVHRALHKALADAVKRDG